MAGRRPLLGLSLVALFSFILLLSLSSSALAGTLHPFVSSFGPGGPGVGVFGDVEGVAVDQASGNVYVLDASQGGGLYRFDAEGNPEVFLGGAHCTVESVEVSSCIEGVGGQGSAENELAVDSSSGPAKGDIYVSVGNSTGGKIGIFGATGISLGTIEEEEGHAWGEPCGVAVDPSGEVYVGLFSGNVNKYKPSSSEPGHVEFVSTEGGVTEPCNVAADSEGNVFAATWLGGPVTKFPGASRVDAAGSTLAVDPATDDLYVDEGDRIAQFGPHGEPFEKPIGVSGSSGEGAISGSFGVAVNGTSGRLYAASGPHGVNIYGPGIEVPAPVVTIDPPSNITSTSATFTGTVNPEGTEPLEDASWHFEYSINGGETWISTPGGDAGTGTSPVPVSDQVSTFLPDQPVQVRLVASNAANTVTSSVESFTTVALPPDAVTQQAQDITPTHAVLEATLNAHHAPSTFFFEYGPTTAYGTNVPAGQDGDAGSSPTTIGAAQPLYNLSPGTTYHYRIVVHNLAGTVQGADQTFTTTVPLAASTPRPGIPGAGVLPDDRGWEQTSPTTKHGADVMSDSGHVRAAATEAPQSPMAATFGSLGGFADVRGTNISNDYMTIRTGQPGTDGWVTHGITPPQQPLTFLGAFQSLESTWENEFSPDLSTGVFRSWTPLTNDPNVNDVANLYRRDDLRAPGVGAYQLLTSCPLCSVPLPPVATYQQLPWFAGASSDFSHVMFESSYPLVSGSTASDGNPNLYEWDHGTLRLAGILPDSACVTPPCVAPASIAGNGTGAGSISSPRTISSDGSRIIFTDPSNATAEFSGNLYMRINGTSTIQLNASEKTVPDPSQQARYQTASTDGTRVFFTSKEQLTDTPTNGTGDLYMYDTTAPAGHHLTLISVDHEPADAPNGVNGVIGASADGQYVYFIAGGQLVAGAPVLVTPLVTALGIYEWHDGVVSYIGRLATGSDVNDDVLPNLWVLRAITARVAPDGRHMLFKSSAAEALTGYQSNGHTELFLYNGVSHELQCVSCRPDGSPAGGDVNVTTRTFSGGSVTTSHMSHPLSDDGRRVFFTSPDALVPQDTNGRRDAYEFDSTSGTVHLLSGGRDTADSYFMDASSSGGDVFFLTSQELVGWDTDQNGDLYDARVGGGLPNPSSPQGCSGDGCHGALVPGPAIAPSGSETLLSRGNVKQSVHPKPRVVRCRRGFVRKRVHGKVRCARAAKKKPKRGVRHAVRARQQRRGR